MMTSRSYSRTARGYRTADPAAGRTLKTSFGPVAYVRAFLVPRHGAMEDL